MNNTNNDWKHIIKNISIDNCGNNLSSISKNDITMLKSHNFKLYYTPTSKYPNLYYTLHFKCSKCMIKLAYIEFLDGDKQIFLYIGEPNKHKAFTEKINNCNEIIMQRACE